MNIQFVVFQKVINQTIVIYGILCLNYEGFSVEYDENVLRNPIPSMIVPLPLLDVDYRECPINLDGNDSFTIFETFDTKHKEPFKEGLVEDCINEYELNGYNPKTDGLFLKLHLQKEKAIWEIENECRLIIGNVILSGLKDTFRKYFLEKYAIVDYCSRYRKGLLSRSLLAIALQIRANGG